MTSPGDKAAEPRGDADASVDASPSGVYTTAARALSVGAALSRPSTLNGLEPDLASIGIQRLPQRWGSWEDRLRILDDSEEVLQRYGIRDHVLYAEELPPGSAGEHPRALSARVDLWRDLAEARSQPVSVAWLRLLATGQEPVSAVAACAALSHWRPKADTRIPLALKRGRDSLRWYAESSSPEARAIAAAAIGSDPPGPGNQPEAVTAYQEDPISIIVDGTFGWEGKWWYPGGDFHTYVTQEVRPNLFQGRNAFSWSGFYRKRDRETAAERLAGWVEDTNAGSLDALFAHSYGGVIALRATSYGLRIANLVLLSVPAEHVRTEWRNIERAASLRIHLDLVLLAARRPQLFTENVEEHYLPRWFWSHGDSHNPSVWKDHGCSAALGLTSAPG